MRISGIDFFIFLSFWNPTVFFSYSFSSFLLPGTYLLFSSSEDSGFKRFHPLPFFLLSCCSISSLSLCSFFDLFLIQTLCFLTPLHSFHPLCIFLPRGGPEAVPCSMFNWMNRRRHQNIKRTYSRNNGDRFDFSFQKKLAI